MLTLANKILLQIAETGGFNLRKMNITIRWLAALCVLWWICMSQHARMEENLHHVCFCLVKWSCSSKEQPRSARVY